MLDLWPIPFLTVSLLLSFYLNIRGSSWSTILWAFFMWPVMVFAGVCLWLCGAKVPPGYWWSLKEWEADMWLDGFEEGYNFEGSPAGTVFPMNPHVHGSTRPRKVDAYEVFPLASCEGMGAEMGPELQAARQDAERSPQEHPEGVPKRWSPGAAVHPWLD